MTSRSRRSLLAGVAAAAALGLACAAAAASTPRGHAAPARLADTGLYADFASGTLAPDVLTWTPRYPLWSDGATKRRFIRVPPGAAIDASAPDAWRFPAGTRVWKEFSFGRRVETRYMELGADGRWVYAAYVWTPDGSDAVLAPARGLPGVRELRAGVWHDIPGVEDCRACHEGGLAPVLGFSALQLSPAADPLAPHAEPLVDGASTLASLAGRGIVRGLPPALLATPPRVAAPTARGRAAQGYLHGNCASCHNAHGPLASLGLDLEQRVAGPGAAGLPSAVARSSRFRLPGEAGEALRIAPGAPERSVLYRRVASRNPFVQMPPFGSHVVDEEARVLLEAWIREDLRSAPASTGLESLSAAPRRAARAPATAATTRSNLNEE